MFSLPKRLQAKYVLLILKGMAMGAADVVPGVSGGTIAFITGIYQELIDSLKRIGPSALTLLLQRGLGAFWRHVNGTFLACVFGGILLSLVSLAHIISYVLVAYPILVWSFFFGLVVASIIFMLRQLPGWKTSYLFVFVMGALLAFAVTELRPTSLPNTWWILMGSGALAICAMILPGISGSFILLIIGVYRYFIEALQNLDLVSLGSFFVGCVCGLLGFSHVLSWLLHRYHNATIVLLTGFLLGSLNVIWPWKLVVETVVNRHGELVPLVQKNILPWQYAAETGQASFLGWSVVFATTGLLLVFTVEYLANTFGDE